MDSTIFVGEIDQHVRLHSAEASCQSLLARTRMSPSKEMKIWSRKGDWQKDGIWNEKVYTGGFCLSTSAATRTAGTECVLVEEV